jgi:hypothetical protein
MSQGKTNGSMSGMPGASNNSGMSPGSQIGHGSQIGQMGSTFGQTQLGLDGGAYGPVQPRQSDPGLTNGAGPAQQTIGPVSPVNEDMLNGLPGPDSTIFGGGY